MSLAPASTGNNASLEHVLIDQLKNRPAATEGLVVTVALDATDGDGWTVSFERAQTSLAFGARKGADLFVSGEAGLGARRLLEAEGL